MSAWLLASVSLLYALAGVGLMVEGKPGMALFCLGCTVANVGLMIQARVT